MTHLHERLARLVTAWRAGNYLSSEYPALAEILEWARDIETGRLRFLRPPQLQALETYWYLRVVEQTPHAFDLYRRLYPRLSELLTALGLNHSEITTYALDEGPDALWTRIRTDDAFVR
ncbi:MAG: restriction endonuclease subunit R, partial [Nitrospiraceae bacterium]